MTLRKVICTQPALLSLTINIPQKEIARLPYPLLIPEKEWEIKRLVKKAYFPISSIIVEDSLHIYFGAADEQITHASLSLSALLKELMFHVIINPKPKQQAHNSYEL